ncbi:hypothetical protein [Mucilaginibacter sp. SP1R1]|uniref:hypothetical protein n=1 Tax=Mucilaginibacter sp. SP1R1 TaxID=2723091 RepID=UPI00161006E1|nr:hypothetical protein [Mucilaginibacter sp. SP1R1]MBB6151340.1 hypothetical protein [Mucilaginibacter sp. SP1R1]
MSRFGLFTPYTIRFHTDLYNEPASALLKRSLILFDHNIYLEPRGQDKDFVKQIIGINDGKEQREVMALFKPVSEFVTDEWLDERRFTVDPETNLWYGPHGQQFGKFIKQFLTDRFGFDAFNYQNAKEFEMVDYYTTALSADFNFLLQISNYNPDISALFTELHRDAYFATYHNSASTPERVLEKVCSVNYFDFGKLSWTQILELKRSHFLKDFRAKFLEWLTEFEQTHDLEKFEHDIDRYIRSSTFKFLEANRPAVITDSLTGILGNVPLPIPLNPVSIYSSFMSVRKDILQRNKFGWLFFIQEAYQQYGKMGKTV